LLDDLLSPGELNKHGLFDPKFVST